MSDKIKFEPDKFIVINRKHLQELLKHHEKRNYPDKYNSVLQLEKWQSFFHASYASNIGPLDNKYYVCNQDEPYADKVLEVILEGEREKLKKKEKPYECDKCGCGIMQCMCR